MRCLALAEQFRSDGYFSVFVSNVGEVPWVEERIENLGFEAHREDENDLLSQLLGLDPLGVVIDSYQDRSILALGLNRAGVPVLAIADAVTPPLPAQLVITPGPLHKKFDWARDHRFGAEYLLLRSEVLEVRRVRSEPNWRPTSENEVLVILGGTGQSDLLETDVFEVLLPVLADFPDIEWSVIADSRMIDRYQGQVERSDLKTVSLIPAGTEMFKVAEGVSMALSSAGVSSLELDAMGVPLMVVQTASNQRDNVDYLKSVSGASFVGSIDQVADDPGLASALLRESMAEIRRASKYCRAASVIDTNGTSRVAQLIESLIADFDLDTAKSNRRLGDRVAIGGEVSICDVTSETATWLWVNRFTDGVVAVSRTKVVPTLRSHIEWLDTPKGLSTKIIFVGSTPVGSVRVDLDDERQIGIVSIFVTDEWQGRGIAVEALGLVERGLKREAVLVAHISNSNTGSQRTFAKAGYIRINEGNLDEYPEFSVSANERSSWSTWLRRVPSS